MNDNLQKIEGRVFDRIELTAVIVSAYLSNNRVSISELASLIAATHTALIGLDQASSANPQTEKPTSAQIRKSITPDALISFIDGKPYKALKRHLGPHGLTIETYRERYGLPMDYPAVASNYSEARSSLARSFGFGQSRRRSPTADDVAAKPSKKRA